MKPQDAITAELQSLAPGFPPVSRSMPHFVPEHYFDELPQHLLRQVATTSVDGAAVPEGYFENLPQLLLQKVRQQEAASELEEIAPLLNSISKQPVGYVPPAYFERTILPPHAPAINRGGSARIALMRRLAPLAVAACLALGLWLGYSWYQQQANTTDALAATPKIEEALKSLDDQTIARFLESTSASGAYANPEINLQENVEVMLKDIQSETLEQYLNTMPTLVPNDKTDM